MAWVWAAERRLFSFAIVRQNTNPLLSDTSLKKGVLQLYKVAWILKLENLSLLVDKNHIVTKVCNQIKVMG